jgi:DNA-binding response OmpR family regulator
MSTAIGRLEGRRVIVTDDNASKLTIITQILREAGFCVFAAYDGASALELVAQIEGVSLLVTNTRLGIVHGPELIRRTRELRPGMAILHVVHQDGPAQDLLANVLNLREPFTPEELLVVVRGLLH